MASSYLSRLSLWSTFGLTIAVAVACGGSLGAPGGSFQGTGGSAGESGESGGAVGSGGVATGGMEATGGNTYVDPDCPTDVSPPPPVEDCDPLNPQVGCAEGFACYPYLEYPYGEGCGYALHGATCQSAGVGTQGDSCEFTQCSPGFLCVVGSGSGARCAKLCPLVGDDGCDPGFICGEVDVPGYGVCS